VKIKINQLKKEYREGSGTLSVIDSLDAEFPNDCRIAIVGASGIGKSTFLHLLGGLDSPSSGNISYDDIDICSLSNEALSEFRGKHIGFIFQFHHLLPEFTALENVLMPLLIAGVSENSAARDAKEILDAVGLSQRITHRPGELSGGEQQRVAIARSLIARPQVILADEPTGNLDQKTAQEVQELLLSMSRQMKSTLIVVTHNAELARSMDLIYEMKPGGKLILLSK